MRCVWKTSRTSPANDGIKKRQGPNTIDSVTIMVSWTITIQDDKDVPVSLKFDITDDNSPITVGVDLKMNIITNTFSRPKIIRFNRQNDNQMLKITIYKSGNTKLTIRLRLLISPVIPTTVGLLGNILPLASKRPITLVKRFHNSTHATAAHMIRILKC